MAHGPGSQSKPFDRQTVYEVLESFGPLSGSTYRDGPAPFAHGERPDLFSKDAFQKVVTKEDIKFIREFLDEFKKLGPAKRMDEIPQSGGSHYSSLGRDEQGNVLDGQYDNMRGEHCDDVADLALLFALHKGLTVEQALICAMVGQSHDWGHPAFAHNGEEVLRARGFTSFDHDAYTVILASMPEIRQFCESYGISHKDYLAALAGPPINKSPHTLQKMQDELEKLGLPYELGLDLDSSEDQALIRKWSSFHVLVQDHLDCIAYEVRDWRHSEVSEERKRHIAKIAFDWLNALEISETGELATSSVIAFEKFFRVLGHKYQERACGWRSAVTNEVLFKVLERSGVTNPDIIVDTDKRIVPNLSDDDREILELGSDRRYRAIMTVLSKYRTEHGLPAISGRLQNREIRALKRRIDKIIDELIADGELPGDREYLVNNTPPLHKKFDLLVQGTALEEAKEILARKGNGKGPVIMNKYPDDLFFTTLDLRPNGVGGGRYAEERQIATLEVVAMQGLVVAVERKGDERKDLEKPVYDEQRIYAVIEAAVNRVLEEESLKSKLSPGPIGPDRYGHGSKERAGA